MVKSSFTVSYRNQGVRTTVLGVTSIVPNLNGFLFFTEDGQNHFIECCDLKDNSLSGIFFEYSTEVEIDRELSMERLSPELHKVIDHRNH